MSASPPPPARRRPRTTKDGRDEMNIAEFPVALLSDRAPRGIKTLEFQDIIWDQHSGQPVTRKLLVQGTERLGLPTAKDDEVLLGLIQLTRLRNGFADRKVHFSRYELIRLLGWNDEGKNYRRLEASLHRWASVYLSYEKAWWDNRRKSWVDEGFHILERVTLYEREGRGGGQQSSLPFSSFTWGEVFFRSFQDGYLKAIDLDFFLRLETATAKRVYRFLDKHFYHRSRLEYELVDFACEHVGLSRDYHTGKIKEKLAPAIRELEAKGFLEPLSDADRYLQVRRGEWKVIFLKKAPPTAKGLSRQDAIERLEKMLTDRGVTPASAAELAAAHPPERIAAKAEVFDWLSENKDPRLSKNPAGYLVESIRKDYQPPPGFEPREERERKRQAAATAKQRREQQEEERRVKERREAEERQAERARIQRALEGLSAEERQGLEKRALESAEPAMRQQAQGRGALAEAARRVLVERQLLREQPLPEAAKK